MAVPGTTVNPILSIPPVNVKSECIFSEKGVDHERWSWKVLQLALAIWSNTMSTVREHTSVKNATSQQLGLLI